MEEKIQNKSITNNKIVDFLSYFNPKKNDNKKDISSNEIKLVESSNQSNSEGFKCEICMKLFTSGILLKEHQQTDFVCKGWINLPKKIDNIKLTKGIHLIVDELLQESIGYDDDKLECKFCKTKFTSKVNNYIHFNSSTLCNKKAYQEFKYLLNNYK